LISGEGSGNYLKSCMTTTKKVTLIYRSRHTAYFKRLQPGTLETTQSANKMIHRPTELAQTYGTRFISSIVYGAQLDVAFTVTSSEDINVQEMEAELKGKIGVGPLSVGFKAKFEKKTGAEKALYNMAITAKAIGVKLDVPANPTFEQVAYIINNFNEKYDVKFKNHGNKNTELLQQLEPVGFMTSSIADSIETLSKEEIAVVEDKMKDLGKAFSETMYWKAKLDVINTNLKQCYEKDHKLRAEMYDPYYHELEKVMVGFQESISKCLEFRALPLQKLVAGANVVPCTYPKTASEEEYLLRGLSGELYIPSPVHIGDHEPLDKDIYYIGFALKKGDTFIPWMSGCLQRSTNGITETVATAETPENLYNRYNSSSSYPIKDGDTFDYPPWEGTCIAKFVNGALWVYKKTNKHNNGLRVWKCQNSEDTRKLLSGSEVSVRWDNKSFQIMKLSQNRDFIMISHKTVFKKL
jgi:hypothetical protein